MSEPRCSECVHVDMQRCTIVGKRYVGEYIKIFTMNSPFWCPRRKDNLDHALNSLDLEDVPDDTMPDNISHPTHYARFTIEPVDFLQSLTRPKSGPPVPWHGLNAIKYIVRYQTKNGLEDLKKARQYLDWLIEEEERHGRRVGE